MLHGNKIFWAVLAIFVLAVMPACGGGGGGSSNSSTISTDPIANAGPNQNVSTGTTVTLDGSGSNDPDGNSLSFLWSLVSKPQNTAAELSDPSVVKPTFTADVDGEYVFTLTVNNGSMSVLSGPVTVTAATGNSAPVANAGPDQDFATGSVVTLDGSGSYDADGDLLTYSWSLTLRPDGSTATLSSSTTVNPTFTADLNGTYVLSLIVNDGTVYSEKAIVTIVAASSIPPAPTDLIGTALFSSIMLQWEYPSDYKNLSHAEIWKQNAINSKGQPLSENFSNAVFVAENVGSMYVDQVGTYQAYYYWIRFVSDNQVSGPFISTPVYAETAKDPETELCILTAQITGGDICACGHPWYGDDCP